MLPPPELKVTGSIPVGSISFFAGITHDARRFSNFFAKALKALTSVS
jgi:hypothetical protein